MSLVWFAQFAVSWESVSRVVVITNMPALYRPIATKQQETSKHTNTHIHTAWLSPVHCYRVKYERFKAWFSTWNTFTFLSLLWSGDQGLGSREHLRPVSEGLKAKVFARDQDQDVIQWQRYNKYAHVLAWLHTVYQVDRVYTDVSTISRLLCLL